MNSDKPLPIFHPKGIISVMIEGWSVDIVSHEQ